MNRLSLYPPLTPPQKFYLTTVDNSAQALPGLINDILESKQLSLAKPFPYGFL